MRILSLCVGLTVLVACQSRSFDPPLEPVHDQREEGFLHARGYEEPFLCLDPVSGNEVACPMGRPDRVDLSCDAAGCHGNNDYTQPASVDRALHGSDGPSCWTCHDQEWSGRTE
ncbi:MAG: hypothetical protein ACJAZO_005316 [Myxococcota bacterium]|jgi:hypothetical protein